MKVVFEWLTVWLTFTCHYRVQSVMCSKHSTKCKHFIDMHTRMTQLGKIVGSKASSIGPKGYTRQFTIEVKKNTGHKYLKIYLHCLYSPTLRNPQTEELKCFNMHTVKCQPFAHKIHTVTSQRTFMRKNICSFYQLSQITIIHLFVGGIGSSWQYVKRSEIMSHISFPNFHNDSKVC